jgi:DNA polymerase I-like protein with 3'-5' exonuclease and polymerase domains
MRNLVKDVMESAVKLIVPVKVDTKSGKNWGEMK